MVTPFIINVSRIYNRTTHLGRRMVENNRETIRNLKKDQPYDLVRRREDRRGSRGGKFCKMVDKGKTKN